MIFKRTNRREEQIYIDYIEMIDNIASYKHKSNDIELYRPTLKDLEHTTIELKKGDTIYVLNDKGQTIDKIEYEESYYDIKVANICLDGKIINEQLAKLAKK